MNEQFVFAPPLKQGTIIKRLTQFTMLVDIDGVETRCHCPSLTRIGDFDNAGLPCLYSVSDDPNRKLPITVEAVSVDDHDPHKWIGINMVKSNRMVEHFLRTHQLDAMISDYTEGDIRREVPLGLSKLDFLVGNTYLEVKTMVMSLDVEYGPHIKVQKQAPLHDIDRMLKHSMSLADSLKDHERAIMLTVHQYVPDNIVRPHPNTRQTEHVIEVFRYVLERGMEWWTLNLNFQPDGVSVHSLIDTTQQNLEEMKGERIHGQ